MGHPETHRAYGMADLAARDRLCFAARCMFAAVPRTSRALSMRALGVKEVAKQFAETISARHRKYGHISSGK